jgi:hypothetical protein
MKKLITALFLLSAICLPGVQADESTTDKVLDGLLKVGVQALKVHQESRATQAAAEPGLSESEVTETDRPRTWRDRGREAISTLVTGTADGLGDKPLSEVLAGAVKSAVDKLINEYKEQYKQEGREYAKEVGDKIVTRVINDPKISHSIYSLQALCWGVIVYLTLVTLVMVFSLLHLKRSNNKLLTTVEELKVLLKNK